MNFNSTATARRTTAMDRRRLRRDLRRPDHAGRRDHPARSRLHRGARKDIVGIVADPRPRGPYRRHPALWPRLQCPLYATPFTAFLLRGSCARPDLLDEVQINEVPLSRHVHRWPVRAELITLTHSIPEPNGSAIRTPLGTVLHTGDWKIDPDPLLGATTDMARAAKARR